ncbi:MAG: YicC family protein [Halobacteriovorax sp.]|nr:YicC family protein [Halobacteriovorax sp.]
MIYSMTGFGRGEGNNDDYAVTVELKSVNHRFKDTRFKMSSAFNSIELDMKKRLNEKFKRGSFDIFVNYKRSESNSKFADIDSDKVKSFISSIKEMTEGAGVQVTADATSFLRNEFYVDQDLSKDKRLMSATWEAFDAAVESLSASRLSEGEKMLKVIQNHKKQYEGFYQFINSKADSFQESVEEKLKKRFHEYASELNVDEPRFMQEVIYYLEKLDVHEEINRIQAHLEKLDKILSDGGEVGRQIDFLIQELNRETNTIGSKSNLKDISDSVVQMKVQLEKIREQGLNLE